MNLKFNDKVMDPTKLSVDFKVNWREKVGYDIPAMKSDIFMAGRILEALHVLDPKDCERLGLPELMVLRGNRRKLTADEILADKDSPAGLVEALRKTPTRIVSGFVDIREIEDYMLDSSVKPLSRTEVVHAVWRLQQSMHSKFEIYDRLYQLLARYTGNQKKAAEVAAITEPRVRKEVMMKWFHGTVDNFIMAINQFGQGLKDLMTLTSHKEDSILTNEEEKRLWFTVNRVRVTKLSAAKTKDKAEPTGWMPVDSIEVVKTDDKIAEVKVAGGGVAFNALITEFCMEAAGEIEGGNKARPTSKTLEALSETMKSPAVRTALLAGAGKKSEDLASLDEACYRNEKVIELLKATADRLNKDRTAQIALTNGRLADILNAIAVSGPTAVEALLKSI